MEILVLILLQEIYLDTSFFISIFCISFIIHRGEKKGPRNDG